MSLSQIQLLQINRQVDRILHNRGNQPGTNGQLEIAFVLDRASDKDFIVETAKAVAASLKRHDKVFENVRCNIVNWGGDNKCITSVVPMSFVVIGKISDSLTENKTLEKEAAFENKGLHYLESLTSYLKLFHARSKCIIFISQGDYVIEDKDKFIESMNPFLKTKFLMIEPENIVLGSHLLAEIITGS